MNLELRYNKVELRSEEDGTMTVSGYVNMTNQLSNILGVTKKFKEKIMPGAFMNAIRNATRDIDFLGEHNNKTILASTRNESLKLTEDENGLYMEATIAPTSWGKDYYTLISSGILQNMSFGFRTIKDSWKLIEANLYERTIEELELFEVSVVRDPAYSQSTIAARGIDVVEEVEIPIEIEEEARNMEELRELLLALKEEVTELKSEIKELRSEQVAPEVTPEPIPEVTPVEEVKEPEVVVEPEVVEPEVIEKEEEITPVEDEKTEEVIEEKVEEEVKEEVKEEKEEEEIQRSDSYKSELAELRSKLTSLK